MTWFLFVLINYEYMTFLYVVHVYMFCNVVLYCIALPARVLLPIKIIIITNQAKYYAQDTGNQYSMLGRLIYLPDCDKTSEKRKRKSVVFGINVYLNKFDIKF
jgi:hypothetical protein